ncbi:MAG: carboxypeptidase M32 [Candidatus Saccharimonadales bacterium]
MEYGVETGPEVDESRAELYRQLSDIAQLRGIYELVQWYEITQAPEGAGASVGAKLGYLALKKQEGQVNLAPILAELRQPAIFDSLSEEDRAIIRAAEPTVARATQIPAELIEEKESLLGEVPKALNSAKKADDFELLSPDLKKMVDVVRRQGLSLRPDRPYDALLEDYEPGLTAEKLDELFKPLADATQDLVRQAAQFEAPKLAFGEGVEFPIEKQQVMLSEIAQDAGFDFTRGALDSGNQTGTAAFHPDDVRIVIDQSDFDKKDPVKAVYALMHELGHGLYEQGLPVDLYRTPLGEPASTAIHESQSRLWENHVAKSRPFVNYLFSKLQEHFGDDIMFTSDELYIWVNRVEPGPKRVEADELTYPLHIIIRYELERDLIRGDLAVEALPQAWNQKTAEYLGQTVESDLEGVLQDPHWAWGEFGYFPTYALGDLYAAQLYAAAKHEITDLEAGYAQGNFAPLKQWLSTAIYQPGKRYTPEQLIERSTGSPPSPKALMTHLESKLNILAQKPTIIQYAS